MRELYTSINEFKKAIKEGYYDAPEYDDNVIKQDEPKSYKYDLIIWEYPNDAILKNRKTGEHFLYSYDEFNEEIYNNYLEKEITGHDEDGVDTEVIPMSESEPEVLENIINLWDPEVKTFSGDIEDLQPDTLYKINDELLSGLKEEIYDKGSYYNVLNEIK